MVQAKIRVEALSTKNSPSFFGNVLVKKVTEETLMRDYDNRKNVASSGIVATIKVSNNTILDICVNRYYFGYEGSDVYVASFSIEEKVYEIWVKFDNTNKNIEDLWLSEWLQSGDFENSDYADNIYHMEDFTTYAKFLS